MDPIVTFLKQGMLPKIKGMQRKCVGMLLVIGYSKSRSCISVLIQGHIYVCTP